jgi:hypothetical protein
MNSQPQQAPVRFLGVVVETQRGRAAATVATMALYAPTIPGHLEGDKQEISRVQFIPQPGTKIRLGDRYTVAAWKEES